MRDVRLPDFPFTMPIEVWFRELDAMGHVNNAVFFTYFEEVRTRYWMSLVSEAGEPADLRKLGFIVVHAECDYASQATMGEPLLIGCRVAGIGRKSFQFDYRIVSGEERSDAVARIVATGKSIQALYDWDAKTTVPFGDELRRKIETREGGPLRTLSARHH
jgi:acyl-CoA thioester hydrolase